MSFLRELIILACFAALVVVFNLLQEVSLCCLVEPDSVSKLLKGIALPSSNRRFVTKDVLALLCLAFDEVEHGLGIKVHVNAAGEQVPEHAATILQAISSILREIRVKNGESHGIRLIKHLEGLGLNPGSLVEETLAVLIHKHERPVKHRISLWV